MRQTGHEIITIIVPTVLFSDIYVLLNFYLSGETEVDVQKGQTMARKKVKITISRGDLGARYECRAQNDALETPLVSYVDLDVYGKTFASSLITLKLLTGCLRELFVKKAILGEQPPYSRL